MLTNLQLELLKLYNTNLSDEELMQLKEILANFFAKKTITEADKIWEKNNFDNQLMDKWLNEEV